MCVAGLTHHTLGYQDKDFGVSITLMLVPECVLSPFKAKLKSCPVTTGYQDLHNDLSDYMDNNYSRQKILIIG